MRSKIRCLLGGDAKRDAHVEVLEQSMTDYVSFIHRKAPGMRVGEGNKHN